MYDDRPLFLSFFYSDTLFGLVMQNVKELKFWEYILYAWAPVPSGIYLVDI
jgi:hypothetical protein